MPRVTRAQAKAFDYEEATGTCGNPYCDVSGCPENHPLGYPQSILIEGVVFEVNWDPPTSSEGMDQLRALKKHAHRLAQRPDEETIRKGHRALDDVSVDDVRRAGALRAQDAQRQAAILAAMYQPEEEA